MGPQVGDKNLTPVWKAFDMPANMPTPTTHDMKKQHLTICPNCEQYTLSRVHNGRTKCIHCHWDLKI